MIGVGGLALWELVRAAFICILVLSAERGALNANEAQLIEYLIYDS
jgi:hypothetical protein